MNKPIEPQNSDEPIYCPYCRHRELWLVEDWKAVNIRPSNDGEIQIGEYECRNEKCGRSFWV